MRNLLSGLKFSVVWLFRARYFRNYYRHVCERVFFRPCRYLISFCTQIIRIDDRRLRLLRQSFQAGSNKSIVLTHMHGGGTEDYLSGYMAGKESSDEVAVVCRMDAGFSYLDYYVSGKCVLKIRILGGQRLWFFLRNLCADELIINSLTGWPSILTSLYEVEKIVDHGCILTVHVHDHLLLCPSVFLINTEGRYCGLPAVPECERCYARLGFRRHYATDMRDWRIIWGSVLKKSQRIICFSRSSAHLVRVIYGAEIDRRLEVIPHADVQQLRKVRRSFPQKSLAVNVAVIGRIQEMKGSRVLHALGAYIRENDLEMRLFLFGTWEDPNLLPPKGLVVRAFRAPEALPELMERSNIHVVLMPSVVPETFSYVLSEVFQMHLPVVCFDMGAQGERVAAYEYGIALPDAGVESIVNGLKRASRLGLAHNGPVDCGHEVSKGSDGL